MRIKGFPSADRKVACPLEVVHHKCRLWPSLELLPTLVQPLRNSPGLARPAPAARASAARAVRGSAARDVFVNFDDERTVAGLEALADFGASCQVLLFTHNRHVGAVRLGLPVRRRAVSRQA